MKIGDACEELGSRSVLMLQTSNERSRDRVLGLDMG